MFFARERNKMTHIQPTLEETGGDSLAKVRLQPKELQIPTSNGDLTVFWVLLVEGCPYYIAACTLFERGSASQNQPGFMDLPTVSSFFSSFLLQR